MALENLVMAARDPLTAGMFWEAALGLTPGYVAADGYEGRLDLGEGLFLDVCFEPTTQPPAPGPRLHPDLLGGARQAEVVERLLGLGARRVDIGQGDVPWVVLADPEGNPFCVMEARDAYRDTGPIAALPLDSADPDRDGALYAALTGWVPCGGYAPVSLRHPRGRGPLLELCPEPARKTGQNRLHLDVRPEPGGPSQGDLVELALSMGATLAHDDWAHGHPWVVLRDTSGNEFCVLSDPVAAPRGAMTTVPPVS